MFFFCLQDLLEAVKPILDEDLQEAVESLLMESAAHDAKNLYNAMKVRYHQPSQPRVRSRRLSNIGRARRWGGGGGWGVLSPFSGWRYIKG